MRWWTGLRILVYMRRIDKSLARIADSLERHEPEQDKKPKARKPAEVFNPSIQEWNEDWRTNRDQ